MRLIRLLCATALLVPAIPSVPAAAQAPQWGAGYCGDITLGGTTCYAEDRGECEYLRAVFRRQADVSEVSNCRPSNDDPYNLGSDWEFDVHFA